MDNILKKFKQRNKVPDYSDTFSVGLGSRSSNFVFTDLKEVFDVLLPKANCKP
jgi:hypothetical protein